MYILRVVHAQTSVIDENSVGTRSSVHLVYRKTRLNGWTFGLDRVNRGPVSPSRCDTIKTPPCSKITSAELSIKFCRPSPAMMTSPYCRMGRKTIFMQSINQYIYERYRKTDVIPTRLFLPRYCKHFQLFSWLVLWNLFFSTETRRCINDDFT